MKLQVVDDLNSPYFAVPIEHFRRVAKNITFDIYLKIAEDNFIHVFSKTTGIDYKRLAHYLIKGVSFLYVRKEDREAYELFFMYTIDEYLTRSDVPMERKVALLLNVTEQSMTELFTSLAIDDETAKATQKVVETYIDLLTKGPDTLVMILKLVAHGNYLYYHSISTSIFSLLIAKSSGLFDRHTMEQIGLGGFLHDVGCGQLPKDIIDSPTDLTPEQWNLMREHPAIGLRMIANTPSIPDEVRYIVYQHHERPNGAGYPNGLKGNAIFYPAKIVSLADGFGALISQRPFRAAYSVDQALHILESDTGHYNPELVRVLSNCFTRHSHRNKKAS